MTVIMMIVIVIVVMKIGLTQTMTLRMAMIICLRSGLMTSIRISKQRKIKQYSTRGIVTMTLMS